MILLIDNYDSFVYNLYQIAGAYCPDVEVVRNDVLSIADIASLAPQALILSPGPGRPEGAGVCVPLVRALAKCTPILGVCLGHQAICAAYGAQIGYAKTLMHGKASKIHLVAQSALFAGMRNSFSAARYHSLAVKERTLTSELQVLARSTEGEVMAVRHVQHPVFGVQFHPESVLTPLGSTLIKNFLTLAGALKTKDGERGNHD